MAKYIIKALKHINISSDLDAILVSHEHTDHIKGAGVLSRKFNIPVCKPADMEAMKDKLGNIKSNMRIFYTNMDFYIKDINVQSLQYPMMQRNRGFCFITAIKN